MPAPPLAETRQSPLLPGMITVSPKPVPPKPVELLARRAPGAARRLALVPSASCSSTSPGVPENVLSRTYVAPRPVAHAHELEAVGREAAAARRVGVAVARDDAAARRPVRVDEDALGVGAGGPGAGVLVVAEPGLAVAVERARQAGRVAGLQAERQHRLEVLALRAARGRGCGDRARARERFPTRTSMPSPHSASCDAVAGIATRPRPRVASTMIPAHPLCRPSLIGTPTPGAVVGTLNGGMWKPGVQRRCGPTRRCRGSTRRVRCWP